MGQGSLVPPSKIPVRRRHEKGYFQSILIAWLGTPTHKSPGALIAIGGIDGGGDMVDAQRSLRFAPGILKSATTRVGAGRWVRVGEWVLYACSWPNETDRRRACARLRRRGMYYRVAYSVAGHGLRVLKVKKSKTTV